MTETRLLVRGVNWLGDAVMTTPALQRLREARPDAHITLLTHRKLEAIWLHHPSVDKVVTFEDGESPWSVGRRLRSEKFQTALVLPNSPRSAMEVWFSGIGERIGYARPWRNWLLTKAVPPRPGRVEMHKLSDAEVSSLVAGSGNTAQHPMSIPAGDSAHQMREYLHLVTALGASSEPIAPRVVVSDAEIQKTRDDLWSRLRSQPGVSGDAASLALLGLNAGAEYGPAKRWPAENFAAVAREVSRNKAHCVWLVFGGPNDKELAGRICREAGVASINLSGATTLREFMVLLKLCRVLLTNDTGPMHVAAALGTPVVVPFGSTSPELTGPGLPGDPRHHLLKAQAPCAPCFRRECPIDFRCMKSITVERVVDSVLEAVSAR